MNENIFAYVSSWGRGKGLSGIGAYKYNAASGEMEFLGMEITGEEFNVTCYDKKRGLLYALNETSELPGMRAGGGGRVFTFRIDPATGHLTQIGCVPTWCPNPAYLTLDAEGKYMLVANHSSSAAATKLVRDENGEFKPEIVYDDSVVELFAMNDDGTVGEMLDAAYHYGDGPERRQLHARPHSVVMSPSGRLFAVCDKGNDSVRMYKIDREHNALKPAGKPVQCAPSTLPRYCAFHPTLPLFFHNNEFCMELYCYRYDEEGGLVRLDEISVLPEGYDPASAKVNEQQGLSMHPNGRVLYDIVRGPNTVAVLEIDEQSGRTVLKQSAKVEGDWPRGCAITPDGGHFAVCCVKSGEIIMYSIGGDGTLAATGGKYPQESAAYITFCEL